MSGPVAGSLRFPPSAVGVVALALAAGFGLPIGSWAMAVALVLIAVACLAMIVGMTDAAKGFGPPILGCVAIGLGADMAGAMARAALAAPSVQAVLIGLVIVLLLVAAARMLGGSAGHGHATPRAVRPSLRRRAVVVEPEGDERPHHDDAGDGGEHHRHGTDDLDLYGGGRARR